MGSLLNYSAIAAKVSAMKSRFLTTEQFRELANLPSVPAAMEYLRNLPAYAQIFSDANGSQLHRSQIEQLLQNSLYQDFSSLYRFANMEQRRFLDLYFMHFEIDALKKSLRDAVAGRKSDMDFSVFAEFFHTHSRLNMTGLSESTSLSEFINYLEGSYFYGPLEQLYSNGVTAVFDYETALDSLYFLRLWKNLKHYSDRSEREILKKCIGEKIDLLNLEWLSRAKQYYQLPAEAITSFLIPVHYRLTEEQIQKLALASSSEEFLQIIKGTSYKNRIFSSTDAPAAELRLKRLFRSLLDDVYRSSGRKNPYSAAALNTYFYFKEEEIRKIITAIEGIRYQLNGNEIISYLAEN